MQKKTDRKVTHAAFRDGGSATICRQVPHRTLILEHVFIFPGAIIFRLCDLKRDTLVSTLPPNAENIRYILVVSIST